MNPDRFQQIVSFLCGLYASGFITVEVWIPLFKVFLRI